MKPTEVFERLEELLDDQLAPTVDGLAALAQRLEADERAPTPAERAALLRDVTQSLSDVEEMLVDCSDLLHEVHRQYNHRTHPLTTRGPDSALPSRQSKN